MEPIHNMLTASIGFYEVGIMLVLFVVGTDSVDGDDNQLGDGGATLVNQGGCKEGGNGAAHPVLLGSSIGTSC